MPFVASALIQIPGLLDSCRVFFFSPSLLLPPFRLFNCSPRLPCFLAFRQEVTGLFQPTTTQRVPAVLFYVHPFSSGFHRRCGHLRLDHMFISLFNFRHTSPPFAYTALLRWWNARGATINNEFCRSRLPSQQQAARKTAVVEFVQNVHHERGWHWISAVREWDEREPASLFQPLPQTRPHVHFSFQL